MKNKLLLNADVGEGVSNDELLIPYLSYANIACGGHYGNETSIANTLKIAIFNKVKVGAHPSYPDIKNFGRRSIQLPRAVVFDSVKQQINLFVAQCDRFKIKMNHIKLHGALYNDVFNSEEYTKWFFEWVDNHYPETYIFIPIAAISYISTSQRKSALIEVFADRNYENNLTLVARSNPKAVLNSVDEIVSHVSCIIHNGHITTLSGEIKTVEAQTLCIHGDHSLAVSIAEKLATIIE